MIFIFAFYFLTKVFFEFWILSFIDAFTINIYLRKICLIFSLKPIVITAQAA